jgi:hypothetical protein
MTKLPVLLYAQLEPVLFDDFTHRPGNFRSHLRSIISPSISSIPVKTTDLITAKAG